MSSEFEFSNIPEYILYEAVYELFSGLNLVGGTGSSPFNFSCPRCRHTSSNPNVRKAYIIKNTDNWVYYCQKGCNQTSFIKYLKEYEPSVYGKVIVHGYINNEDNNTDSYYEESNQFSEEDEDIFKEGELLSVTDDHPTCQIAKQQCIDRRIPEKVYNDWFVCIAGKEFYDIDDNDEIILNENGFPSGNEYRNRLIIPYYNFSGYWYQFDGRDLNKESKARYKNRSGDEREFYKIDFLDVTKPFFLTEGAIDASFIENSVAIGGVSNLKRLLLQYSAIISNAHNCTVIWDNDDAGYDQLPFSINAGLRWFNWSTINPHPNCMYDEKGKLRVVKDINDLVMYTTEVTLNQDSYITPESLLKFSEKHEGGVIKVNMLYGNRSKMKYIRQKEIQKSINKKTDVIQWG